jgi:hypothetical protein
MPEVEPKTKPGIAPPAKPGGPSRQQRAAKIVMISFLSLFALGTVSGTVEMFLHGAPFFVFRSAGTGATPGDGTQEDQGPGQPDANHHAVIQHHPKQHQQHQPKGHHQPQKNKKAKKPKKHGPVKHQPAKAKKHHTAKKQPAKKN